MALQLLRFVRAVRDGDYLFLTYLAYVTGQGYQNVTYKISVMPDRVHPVVSIMFEPIDSDHTD